MSDFEDNEDFMCDDEEDYGLVGYWRLSALCTHLFAYHLSTGTHRFYFCISYICRNIRKTAILNQMSI